MILNKLLGSTNTNGLTVVIAAFDNPQGIAAYKWDSSTGFGTKYATPTGDGNAMFHPSISADGKNIIAGRYNAPYAVGYTWNDASGFSTPKSPAVGLGSRPSASAFSPNGSAAAFAHDT